MHTQYERTSISLPADLLGYLKDKSDKLGVPVSRLVAQAVERIADREAKTKKSKEARK